MVTRRVRGLGLAALVAAPAFGAPIEYPTEHRADALLECDEARHRGERAEAARCYGDLLAGQDDVRIQAEAARALGDVQSANDYLQTAVEEYPEDPGVRTRWGELFLETHQDSEAVKLFEEGLALNSDYAPAKLGLAKVSAQRFDDRARQWLDEVLDEAPDSIEARLLLARMDLENGAIDEADERLDEALEIAAQIDAPPLEIYALKASVDLLRGVERTEWSERALEYNPSYGEIYATPAHFYVITRRYREAIDLYQRAVQVQPDLYSAHADLGVNLLRENRVAEAQQHLATAYNGDPFSASTVNTLRLIDSFDNFVVSEHGGEGDSADPAIILRLHKDEAEILEPYVLDLVERSIDVYTERYEFELEEPVIVELYPEHDDFAVRTSGLPGIGLLGVAFGYLVAMDSPSGRDPGEFHWGTTLWHEIAHVFTLEATNHLVPRWFSEGASVFEEWSTGPLPGRHIPAPVLQAIAEDRMLPIGELDRGFIRPTYPNQVIVSYMQAGLVCEFIAENWGQPALAEMLRAYAQGLETVEALERTLDLPAAEFDERFARHIDAEFGDVLDNLEDWQQALRQAHEAAGSGDWDAALASADRAIELYPQFVEPGSAYLVKANAHEALEQEAAATQALETYYRLGGFDPRALRELADRYAEADAGGEALAVLEDLRWVAPLDEALHEDLGDRLLEAGQPERALGEYEALLAMAPHDSAAANYKLARAYLALGDQARGREHLLYALEIAPHYREAQQLLLESVR